MLTETCWDASPTFSVLLTVHEHDMGPSMLMRSVWLGPTWRKRPFASGKISAALEIDGVISFDGLTGETRRNAAPIVHPG